ncbi:MAG: DUF1801 domain-containing protein [Bacteroidia bacterium]
MLNKLEEFYFKNEEELNEVFLYLREKIKSFSVNIEELYRYGVPFFYYNGKPFCYFSVQTGRKVGYIGFVNGHLIDHPKLKADSRKYVKAYYLYPKENIKIRELSTIIKTAIKVAEEKRKAKEL